MLGIDRGVRAYSLNSEEKLREWFESLPEVAKTREPSEILAIVFVVEVFRER